MTLSRMFDASRPPAKPCPGCDAVAGYIGYRGGNIDTPHVWTLAEWQRFATLRQLPIWMPDYNGDPHAQATEAVKRAIGLGWKAHAKRRRVIALDMETKVDDPFVTTFASVLHAVGFGCWVYGSESTVFQNPAADGYWVAQYPGGGPVINYPGEHVVAHQYAADVAWDGTVVDLSVIPGLAVEHLGRGPRHTP